MYRNGILGELKMASKSFFLRGCKAVDKNKKSYKEKAEETRAFSARLADMQRYVDRSEEKRKLLLDLVLKGRSSDSDESLLLGLFLKLFAIEPLSFSLVLP